jgi:hypothetical protein
MEREPNAEAVRRITAYLWGYDLIDIRAAIESFGNGWTVVPKAAVAYVSDSHIERADLIPGDPSNSTDLSMSRAVGDEVRTLDIDSKIQS